MARTRGPRRPVEWYATTVVAAPGLATLTVADDTFARFVMYGDFTSDATLRESIELIGDCTHIRTIGDFWLTTIRTGAVATQAHQWAIGLCVATLEAAIAGAVAFPDPLANPDADWLWYKTGVTSWRIISEINGFTGAAFNQYLGGDGESARFEIDARAMRKIPKGSLLCGVVSCLDFGTATGGLGVRGRTRTLLKT